MTDPTHQADGRHASYSSLLTHRRCPQQWTYDHLRRLRRADEDTEPAVERDMGSWWQALRAADSIERGRALGSLIYRPWALQTVDDAAKISTDQVQVVEAVLDSAQDWWGSRKLSVKEEWVARLGAGLPDQLERLDEAWNVQWHEEILLERPVAVEMRWERELPRVLDSDQKVTLVGYVDEIYWDTRRSLLVVRDNKAHKKLQPATSAEDMMDSQLQLYAWGAAEMVASWSDTIAAAGIRGIAYDRTRMEAPKTPSVTQAGSLSKSVTDYDVDTYRRWAHGPDGRGVPYPGRKKDGTAAGLYVAEPAVIEKLSTPAARSVWFQRTLTPLNANVVRAHLRAAVDTAEDMTRTQARVEREGIAGRNLSKTTCKWCDYASLCRAEMVGGSQGVYDPAEHGLKVVPARL